MTSNVVVIDSTARRAVVKTTPGKYLSDVLSEACSKLGANANLYGLKHNNKHVDLSRTIRLSGLSSGAKLELVQLSKSAGVVSVALQLPQSEAQPPAQARLTDKFPSTTTLWMLLRKFEAGVAGSESRRNLTARGAASTDPSAGRLYYEQPVLNIMGRELSTFTHLQKTLSQLGFNSGSALIKLTYKTSELPLEEAMSQIQAYFDEVDPAPPYTEDASTASDAADTKKEQVKPEWLEDEQMQDVPAGGSAATAQPQPDPSETQEQSGLASPDPTPLISSTSSNEPTTTISDRPVSVFRPPTSSGPPKVMHNDSDYTPTVEHAQIHQRLLQQESRNKRLPTDAELAAKQKEQWDELSKIESVHLKVRFPDQMLVTSTFGQTDTAENLYQFVRACLDDKLRDESFLLRNLGVRDKDGGLILEGPKRLIMDLQLRGRVLVVFGWDENETSATTRGTKEVLKADLRSQAKEFVAPDVNNLGPGEREEQGVKVELAPKIEGGDSTGAKGKMPKWLKGLGKK